VLRLDGDPRLGDVIVQRVAMKRVESKQRLVGRQSQQLLEVGVELADHVVWVLNLHRVNAVEVVQGS
jgi:hypothetical protein